MILLCDEHHIIGVFGGIISVFGENNMKKEKQLAIFVPVPTHRKLKQVAACLGMSMGGLLTVVANRMLPLVVQGQNPLAEEKKED
jgi:hypothetical protein